MTSNSKTAKTRGTVLGNRSKDSLKPKKAHLPCDEVLLRQALNALLGLIELAETRGVHPSDITNTIIHNLRTRLGEPSSR